MKADISLYLGQPNGPKITNIINEPDSPIQIYKVYPKHLCLQSTNPYVNKDIIYEDFNADPSDIHLHNGAQNALRFKAKKSIIFKEFYIGNEEIKEINSITDYLGLNRIPSYMIITENNRDKSIVKGYNPLNSHSIINEHLPLDLQRLVSP